MTKVFSINDVLERTTQTVIGEQNDKNELVEAAVMVTGKTTTGAVFVSHVTMNPAEEEGVCATESWNDFDYYNQASDAINGKITEAQATSQTATETIVANEDALEIKFSAGE